MAKTIYNGKRLSGLCDRKGHEVTLRRIQTTCATVCQKNRGFDTVDRVEILRTYVSDEYLLSARARRLSVGQISTECKNDPRWRGEPYTMPSVTAVTWITADVMDLQKSFLLVIDCGYKLICTASESEFCVDGYDPEIEFGEHGYEGEIELFFETAEQFEEWFESDEHED